MVIPIYPRFDKESGITHIGANVFWTKDIKSMGIFLAAISENHSRVISLSRGKNDGMFFAVGKA